MVAFSANNGLETAQKTIARCPQVVLWYFGPFPTKRLLEMFDACVSFSANLFLQNTPDRKVQRICIRRICQPVCAGNEV